MLSLSGKRPEVGAQDHGDCGGELCSWPRRPWRDAGRRGRATARPGGAGARVAGEQHQQKKEEAARHGGDARRERARACASVRRGQFGHGLVSVCVDASTISANDYINLSINLN